jgi:hypothetical protein
MDCTTVNKAYLLSSLDSACGVLFKTRFIDIDVYCLFAV